MFLQLKCCPEGVSRHYGTRGHLSNYYGDVCVIISHSRPSSSQRRRTRLCHCPVGLKSRVCESARLILNNGHCASAAVRWIPTLNRSSSDQNIIPLATHPVFSKNKDLLQDKRFSFRISPYLKIDTKSSARAA